MSSPISWRRVAPLASSASGFAVENWIRAENSDSVDFSLIVRYGKQTDLLKLKANLISRLRETIEDHRETRTAAYSGERMEEVQRCPVCQEASATAEPRVTIHAASYCQCARCTHVFVRRRPTREAISQFYLSDVNYAATYTDRTAAESRLQAIAVPWRDWMVDTFAHAYGKRPASVLDVGCGAGHFVEACRRENIRAAGNEISEASQKFAREMWGLELDGRDFATMASDGPQFDVVTFWGLLEHTPNPSDFLATARVVVGNRGMVIAKLPRWDSLSTASQIGSPTTVIRHLDPMGHIMCFTDASAAELFHRNGFRPVAAWYYGMDVYELIMQACNTADVYEALKTSGELQLRAQAMCDTLRASDGLVIAAIPR